MPHLLQALRRSIKGEKDNAKINIAPKSAVAIVPPKKVIRALYDYEAQSNQELSFSRGDFFHVIGRENDPDWYEACNPALPDARGLVPVAFFQALGRTERDSGQSDGGAMPRPPTMSPTISKNPDHDSGYAEAAAPPTGAVQSPPPTQRMSRSGSRSGAMVYGIVMYDFVAERADELEAKAGEAIIVIAQSNPEWFVAKPIGRLGGPGLIPVSFVEIRDMATDTAVGDASNAIKKAGIPKVEEWKKMAADYKNSSITLGKFDNGAAPQQGSIEQGMERMSIQQGGRTMLEDGRHWELSRYYEDFYDFQIALLTEFPAEAGNTGTQKRTLPYMPGPVNYVTDAITEGRLHNLDAYVKNLLAQPAYIARCTLVKQFFAPREGDYEIDPNAPNDEYRLSGGSQPSSTDSPADAASRQSSKNNLNGNGYGGLSAAPQQRAMGQPSMNRQPSSLSQSQPPTTPGLGPGQVMKIKLYFNGDLIAIRVPTDIQFQQLYDKIVDRLKIPVGEEIQLFYKDEPTGDKPNLMSDNDLDYALQRNEKLLLYVEQV
ncbi:protein scd2/ral3 [Colletotrichum spaethianum]|uniref:Protein scd2/ral3 n=1 Tax=Colletotrichum spaethianum TaxID=700344 RepID=A0AA37LG86_9PEZI|nr:protein scd2/ral3 [Colletotrichum spaethianum]GKT45385.1 protein scd2/ral3 [Colletotrichum spaethianum]